MLCCGVVVVVVGYQNIRADLRGSGLVNFVVVVVVRRFALRFAAGFSAGFAAGFALRFAAGFGAAFAAGFAVDFSRASRARRIRSMNSAFFFGLTGLTSAV